MNFDIFQPYQGTRLHIKQYQYFPLYFFKKHLKSLLPTSFITGRKAQTWHCWESLPPRGVNKVWALKTLRAVSTAQFAQQHIHTSAEAVQQVLQVTQNIQFVYSFLIPQNRNLEKEHILHHKGKWFFWLYKIKSQLENANFTTHSTPADDFADN